MFYIYSIAQILSDLGMSVRPFGQTTDKIAVSFEFMISKDLLTICSKIFLKLLNWLLMKDMNNRKLKWWSSKPTDRRTNY